ncbi:MAG: pantoate--beta-alanine ligase [Bacteroidales bacterium]|nr:pantoate--beta-alanine ligase [Bacteroidales bacterium]
MERFYHISDIKTFIADKKKGGKTIGFVPTMGALHKGHFSLVKKCSDENDVTIVSIFVNPIQFNNKEDLKNYPRDLVKDIEALKKFRVEGVFIPDEKEMYPEPDNSVFDFGILDKVMEGKHREGHFRGVAVVVKKLFEIVEPDKAYFGEKDFQQLAIVKELVRQLNIPVEVTPCPIVREKDGLAMSSRNQLLSPDQRTNSAYISKVLSDSLKKASSFTVEELKQWVIQQINCNTYLNVEYFEIVNDINLQPVKNWSEHTDIHGCIAVNVGNIRLIDNIKYNL